MNPDFVAEGLYHSQRSPYYIVAPDYHEGSSGIRVLHYLCHALNQRGYEAYIQANEVSNGLWTPKLNDEILHRHFLTSRKPIVVYPEIVSGTPLGLGINVRYMLNKPGFIAGHQNYDPDELFFGYQESFLPESVPKNILLIPATDPSKFNPKGTAPEKRQGRYFYFNRLLARGGKLLPISKDAIEISPQNHRSLDELAEIFRNAELLYCYEASSIATEARLCGCPVVYIPNETMLPEFPSNPLGDEGTAWGMTEPGLARAKATVDKIFEKYMKLYDEFLPQLENFIYLTQKKAQSTDFETCFPNQTVISKGWKASGTALVKAEQRSYAVWLAQRQLLDSDGVFCTLSAAIPPPVFHIFVRTFEGEEGLLANTLDSLARQIYPHWHLDVISPMPSPAGLEEIPCVSWHTTAAPEQIKATIDAQAVAKRHAWLLELPPGAAPDQLYLWRLAKQAENDAVQAVFTDDDCYSATGVRHTPRFKPGCNPLRLVSGDLAGPLAIRREAWEAIGGASPLNNSPWFHQLLKLASRFGWSAMEHVPDVLLSYPEKFPSHPASCEDALQEHLSASGLKADLLPVGEEDWNIRFEIAAPTPPVTIAVLSRGQLDLLSRAIDSITQKTAYPALELLVIYSDCTADPELSVFLKNLQEERDIRSIAALPTDTHAARCNLAIREAANKLVVPMQEEAVVLHENWLEELVRLGNLPGVGAVSPRMFTPGTPAIANAGCVLGLEGVVGTPFSGSTRLNSTEYLHCLHVARDVSALPTGAFMIDKTAYLRAGGMDELALGNHLAEVDLSIKLRNLGLRLLYQPRATIAFAGTSLTPEEHVNTGRADAIRHKAHAERALLQRWGKAALTDPYWNPNLSLENSTPRIETDFRPQWQYLPAAAPRFLACTLNNGQGYFRVTSMLRGLRALGRASECVWHQEGARTPSTAELLALNPDTLIVQHYIQDRHLTTLHEWHKVADRPFIVFTADDLLTDLPETNPLRHNIPPNCRASLKYALDRCDRLVVSTEYLAESYRGFIKDIQVVPNCLDQRIWGPLHSKKRVGGKPRIGWAGGTTHQSDLALLLEVIEQTRHEADWIFFGMCPDEIRPLLTEYHPLQAFGEYPARLAALNLDIAVAPLAMHPFNRGKSNLRLLEYGILGIPVVCTDIDPYQDSPACKVRNVAADWIKALRDRIHDADAREAEGQQMKQWVYRHYLLDNRLEQWLQAHLP